LASSKRVQIHWAGPFNLLKIIIKKVGKTKDHPFLLIFFIFLIVGCATQKTDQIPPSFQEKCNTPVWNAGDSWKFIGDGCEQWEEIIIKKDNKLDVRQSPRKQFYGFFNVPFVGLKIFPLQIGRRFGGAETLHTVEGMRLRYFYSFYVVGIMDVKVLAGRFKCYKIELKVSPSILSEEGIGYFYYAPETKSIVKFETKSFLLAKWENYELSSFNIKEK
jgi:hypothetical protein